MYACTCEIDVSQRPQWSVSLYSGRAAVCRCKRNTQTVVWSTILLCTIFHTGLVMLPGPSEPPSPSLAMCRLWTLAGASKMLLNTLLSNVHPSNFSCVNPRRSRLNKMKEQNEIGSIPRWCRGEFQKGSSADILRVYVYNRKALPGQVVRNNSSTYQHKIYSNLKPFSSQPTNRTDNRHTLYRPYTAVDIIAFASMQYGARFHRGKPVCLIAMNEMIDRQRSSWLTTVSRIVCMPLR